MTFRLSRRPTPSEMVRSLGKVNGRPLTIGGRTWPARSLVMTGGDLPASGDATVYLEQLDIGPTYPLAPDEMEWVR